MSLPILSKPLTKEEDPNLQLVDSIQNGWQLADGSGLYLLIKCKDGTVRTTVIPNKKA